MSSGLHLTTCNNITYHTYSPHYRTISVPPNSYCVITITNGLDFGLIVKEVKSALSEGATVAKEHWKEMTALIKLKDADIETITSESVVLLKTIAAAIYFVFKEYYTYIINIATL